jgi:RNA polymerase-binding transcription factor DksA
MDKPLTPQEIQRYKRRLLEEFAAHAGEVEAVERGALEPSGGARFQDVDESVEETGLDADLDVLAAEDTLGYEVHEALERISAGTFGLCEDCEQTIARQRLDLLPYARLCAECARDEAPARGRKP